MSDLILLFLTVDIVALLLLGSFATILPLAACSLVATISAGIGLLLGLTPLLIRAPATALSLPVGPPGISLHFALDPLSACFLVIVFLAGTAIAAFHATTASPTQAAAVRMTAFCLAGTALSVLAADGVALAIGLAITCAAAWVPQTDQPGDHVRGQPDDRRGHIALLIPLLLLIAVCLLTPSGFAPRFDAIRAAPVDPDRATAVAALTIAALGALAWSHAGRRSWIRDALTAGVLIPSGSYLLLRLVADLSGAAAQPRCGFVLLLAGGAVAVVQGWSSAKHPGIDGALGCLARRQMGLAMAGVGLGLVARAADLPGAASFALASTFLAALGGSVAGVVTALAAHTIADSAGTVHLSRLGGLAHTMPATSAALAAGLLGVSAVPPGLGFATLWLMFQSVLSAPRIGGLLYQLPLALTGAALALSAALATASAVRLIGVALLGRPRTPRGAGARENKSPSRTVLLGLAGLSLLAGILPGPVLWVLADPAIRALTGAPTGVRVGLALLVPSISSPSYLALPVLALLGLATGAATLASRWSRQDVKTVGPWADGMTPPVGLPFGEPAAQSAGQGFVPALPGLALPPIPRIPTLLAIRPPSAIAGLWLVLAACGTLLLVLAVLE